MPKIFLIVWFKIDQEIHLLTNKNQENLEKEKKSASFLSLFTIVSPSRVFLSTAPSLCLVVLCAHCTLPGSFLTSPLQAPCQIQSLNERGKRKVDCFGPMRQWWSRQARPPSIGMRMHLLSGPRTANRSWQFMRAYMSVVYIIITCIEIDNDDKSARHREVRAAPLKTYQCRGLKNVLKLQNVNKDWKIRM